LLFHLVSECDVDFDITLFFNCGNSGRDFRIALTISNQSTSTCSIFGPTSRIDEFPEAALSQRDVDFDITLFAVALPIPARLPRAGSNTFVVSQSITTGNFSTLFAIASGSVVYNSSCTNVRGKFSQSSPNNTTTGRYL
jgi:hypothetical protein